MIRLKSSVGSLKLNWKSIPRGREGLAEVEITEGSTPKFSGEVRWRRDADGIWIQLPYGTYGFDLKAELDDSGCPVYSVSQRIGSAEWVGVTSSLGESGNQQNSRTQRAKAVRVQAQMPGKIVRVLVEADQIVQKDQPVVVMEAMKMENEIRAPQAGKVTQVKIAVGQAVETGADLMFIDGSSE